MIRGLADRTPEETGRSLRFWRRKNARLFWFAILLNEQLEVAARTAVLLSGALRRRLHSPRLHCFKMLDRKLIEQLDMIYKRSVAWPVDP